MSTKKYKKKGEINMRHKKITLTLLFCMLCLCFTMSISAATEYTVKFVDTFDGKETVLSSQSVEKNKAATAPSNIPNHKGFAFSKWSTKYNKITKNLTVKAIYKQTHAIVYFVDKTEKTKNIFYLNGKKQTITGKILTKEPKYYEVNAKVTASDFPNLSEKTGYTLKNWTGIKVGQIFKKPTILVAKPNYIPNSYTIVFNGGDDSKGKMAGKKVSYGKKITLPANAFKKSGYTFEYWDGSDGKTYTNKQKVSNLIGEQNGTITLTAHWKPLPTYTITYKSDETTVSDLMYIREEKFRFYDFWLAKGKRPDHCVSFKGPDANGLYHAMSWGFLSFSFNPTYIYKNDIEDDDHKYELKLSGIDDQVIDHLMGYTFYSNPEQYNANSKFTVKNPIRDFYEFDKWVDEKTKKSYKTYTIKKGTKGNKTLIAKWKPTKFTVTVKDGKSTKKFVTDISHSQQNLFKTIFSKAQMPTKYCYTIDDRYFDTNSTILDLLLTNLEKTNNSTKFTIVIDGKK